MLLNLVVLEFEYLEAIREGSLRGLCLREEIHYLASGESLFYILILEEDDLVAVGPDLSLHPVGEDDLFLAALVELLPLALRADDLVNLH